MRTLMRLWTKVGIIALAVVCFAVGGGLVYWGLFLPRTAPPRRQSVKLTAARIARGKYLFEAVSDCNGCHSVRDFTRFGGPVIPGGTGKGQVMPLAGLPGRIVAPNITPDLETGLGSWTDGEKIRAIREGIAKDGRVLFPMMPYSEFRSMSDGDVESLVAYLDSLPPIRNKLPETQIAFPISILIRSAPRPTGIVKAPERDATAVYGEYLVTIGGCISCHTQDEKGQLKEDMRLAGGRLLDTPLGRVVSANISPDPDTGIGSWSEDYFKQRFVLQRAYLHSQSPKIGPEKFTLMPWLTFSQMDEQDLAAIYKYLQKQPSIRNKVETHPARTQRAGL
jgi:mono/diheme cytochrome c family protein